MGYRLAVGHLLLAQRTQVRILISHPKFPCSLKVKQHPVKVKLMVRFHPREPLKIVFYTVYNLLLKRRNLYRCFETDFHWLRLEKVNKAL